MRGGKQTEARRSDEQRVHEVRINTRSLRGGGQQEERKESDDKFCENGENKNPEKAWEEEHKQKMRTEELCEPRQGTIDQTWTSSRGKGAKTKNENRHHERQNRAWKNGSDHRHDRTS